MPGPALKRRRAEAGSEVARALAWLESYPKVSKWMSRKMEELEQLLEAGDGITRVPNFLPDFVAEGALRILEGLPPGRWNDTAAEEDYTHNNIAHRFWSVKAGQSGGGGSALDTLLRAFTLLLPDQFNAFSAARYERDHHIAPHDDRAYTPVLLDTGEVVTCSRELTIVYHLTKDWTEDMGGALVDLEAPHEPQQQKQAASSGRLPMEQGRVYVPQFNSAVFFRVPRYHAVTPLKTDRPRFSVFGWFLQPGQLYDLYTGDDSQQQEQGQQQPGKKQRRRQQQKASIAHIGQHEDEDEDEEQADTRQQRAEEEGEQQAEEAGTEAMRCKLAQRLLAKARTCSSTKADGAAQRKRRKSSAAKRE